MLAAVAEYDTEAHKKAVVTTKLHMQMNPSLDEVTPEKRAQCTQEIQRLLSERQCRNRISTFRHHFGSVHVAGEVIAKCLKWD